MGRSRLAAAILLVLCVGCSDATGPDRDPAGTYDLVSIVGNPLPFDNGSAFVLAGILTLDSHDHWTLQTSVRFSANGPISTVSGDGTFEHHGDEIEFASGGESTGVAAYDGTTIKLPTQNFATGQVEGTSDFRRR